MKKLYTLLLSALIFSCASAQQQILLFTETFENSFNSFDFSTGGAGTNTGNNSWIVNNEYTGALLYPATPSEDSVVSGTISNAPYSLYLHILDQAADTLNGAANCNWNNNTASDRFAFINNPFCTLGLTDVILTFFWTGVGDTNAYGEVYYRVDGVPWTKTGKPKYNNQPNWKYEIIQDTAFNHAQNLQFGFRWINGTGGTANTSFGVDDIIAVGTYDNINSPVVIAIDSTYPSTICQGDYIIANYSISTALCDGTYKIEMSDKNGNFNNPVNGGVFYVYANDTSGAISFQAPHDSIGTCYKIRVNRISPDPVIIGNASSCFTIQDCPESIITSAAPVMMDSDTTCVESAIDVKFYSFGIFGPGSVTNTYTAQLSDASGSFAFPYTLGTLASDNTYSGPPGNIGGLIPQNVPAGCGYYIRVVSNHPTTYGTVIGPFCIKQCDILTNGTQDIHLCINNSTPYPDSTNFNVGINHWSSSAAYDTCNDWTIELRGMNDFSLVNPGSLGVYHNNTGGSFLLNLPQYLSQLQQLNINAGLYYMRVISSCSNEPWNENGTVIRITIGAPDTSLLVIIADTVVCNTGITPVYVNPFNHPPSDYEWSCNGLNNGSPFIWPNNPLLVDFTGAQPDSFFFYVREINFGCKSAYSNARIVIVNGAPDITVYGPTQVCLGDTVTYTSHFYAETYYNWDVSAGGSVLNDGNDESGFTFNAPGTYHIYNFALNECGSDSASINVAVINCDTINAIEDSPGNDVFSIAPVPSSGKLMLTGLDDFHTIVVFDVKGEKVFTVSGNQNSIDLSSLYSGMYLISVSNAEQIINRKIIIQK